MAACTAAAFLIAIAASLQLVAATTTASTSGVTLHVEDDQVVAENGIMQMTLSKPQGHVIAVSYNGVSNLLQYSSSSYRNTGGYWTAVWNFPGSEQEAGFNRTLDSTEFEVISSSKAKVELSFRSTWNSSQGNGLRLSIDKRYVMLQGSSGLYCYAIFEHFREWPALNITEARLVFKLNPDKFHYMAVSDNLQRYMPSYADREAPRGVPLAYKEAVLLIDPIEQQFKGQVDDKYAYSMDNKDNSVHGWISSSPPTGFWVITPSNEFKSGGPLKLELTSHCGPISLTMFLGTHYIGNDIVMKIQDGEYWKKVLGPVFIYLNSNPKGGDNHNLWEDAKAQAQREVRKWPYSFPSSEDFQKADKRGSVRGRLWVRDRYISKGDMPAGLAYIGLASPGEPGSWATESKGYQFWTKTACSGRFTIHNILPGKYNLYAWVPGFLGDYMYTHHVSIKPGRRVNLHHLVFKPPRSGPTLWEIGIPDRTAAEFFIPDPDPKYFNGLFISTEKYRQYGLWERYAELYPKNDLVFTVGASNYSTDWFFAHVTRKVGNNVVPATWQIRFQLNDVQNDVVYTLRIALAAAHNSTLQIQVNDAKRGNGVFTTPEFGGGNAIARHGIHGVEWNFDFVIKGRLLVEGKNTIYLTQTGTSSEFVGVMYDYIRLEGPPHLPSDGT